MNSNARPWLYFLATEEDKVSERCNGYLLKGWSRFTNRCALTIIENQVLNLNLTVHFVARVWNFWVVALINNEKESSRGWGSWLAIAALMMSLTLNLRSLACRCFEIVSSSRLASSCWRSERGRACQLGHPGRTSSILNLAMLLLLVPYNEFYGYHTRYRINPCCCCE